MESDKKLGNGNVDSFSNVDGRDCGHHCRYCRFSGRKLHSNCFGTRIDTQLNHYIQTFVESLGIRGYFAFVGIYFLATMLFIPGSLLTLGRIQLDIISFGLEVEDLFSVYGEELFAFGLEPILVPQLHFSWDVFFFDRGLRNK